MKKKLLCMFLCTIMMLSFVMTSCSVNSGGEDTVAGEEGENLAESDRTPVTLTFWLPTESEVSEETVELVEAAMNDYLKSSFTTAVELKIFSQSEYDAAVEAHIAKIEKKAEEDEAEESRKKEEEKYNRLHGITTEATTPAETETTDVETFKNEWGVTEQRYPSVGEYQMDIFLISDYSTYLKLIDREALHELDTNLNSTSKVLKSYIYPTFLEAAKFNGTTYAIPNNHGVDDFKFLLLNKELVDKYSYDPEKLANDAVVAGMTTPLEQYINAVIRYEGTDVYTPVLSWIEPSGMTYWSDNGDWSVLSSIVPNYSHYSDQGSIGSIFKNNTYKANFKWMKALEERGYISDDPANCDKFAVGVIEGDYSDVAKYEEDYYVSVYEYPTATQQSVFAGAFAVSEYTENLDRAMEIITALNTDKTLRNILQYGVENVHYRVTEADENGTPISIERLNDDYVMNILHTGNSYMAYFDETMTGNEWEDQKNANLSSGTSPFLFCPNLKNENNKDYYTQLSTLSKGLYDRMMATSYEDVDTFFTDAQAEIEASEAFTKLTATDWEFSITYIYDTFYADNFAVEEEVPPEDAPPAEGAPTE